MVLRRFTIALTTLTLAAASAACRPKDDVSDRAGTGPDLTATGAVGEVALSVTTVSAWPNRHVSGAPGLPELVVHADGRFFATVHDDDRATLRTGTLDSTALDDLLDRAATLPRGGYGQPGLDGSTTTLALGPGSGSPARHEVAVWVPSVVDSYTGRARENRTAFNDVLDQADSLVRATGEVWSPESWFVLGGLHTPDAGDPAPAPWPVRDIDPRGIDTDGLGCQVVGAEDADRVRAAQAGESPDVHGWTHAGAVYDVVLLPVLPGVACADLRPFLYPAG